jgi:LYC1 GNAT-like C-terminal domain
MMVVAKENAAETVEVWNSGQHLVEIAQKSNGITGQRAEHLPALAWYRSGNGNDDDVQLHFNEKYVFPTIALFWC